MNERATWVPVCLFEDQYMVPFFPSDIHTVASFNETARCANTQALSELLQKALKGFTQHL